MATGSTQSDIHGSLDELQAHLDALYADMQRIRQRAQHLLKDVLVRKDTDAADQIRRQIGT